MSELSSAVDSLKSGFKHAVAEVSLHRPADSDNFVSVMLPFLSSAEPQLARLLRMRDAVRSEAAMTLAYFGENPNGGKIEDLLGVVTSFSSGLQKAADEMTAHMVKDVVQSTHEAPKALPNASTAASNYASLLAAAAAITQSAGTVEDDIPDTGLKPPPPPPATGHRGQASDSSQASTLKALPTPSLLFPPTTARPDTTGTQSQLRAGPNTSTFTRSKGTVRGTLSKGELDEAIRSIHGGVRRRERTMRDGSGTVSRGGGVRLSKMFLDGKGSVKAVDKGKSAFRGS